MVQSNSLEQSYLLFIEFLMLAKQRVVDLGADYELTGMQTLMVFLLDHPRPMHNFKHIFHCDASNITGLVDGLEQKELAKRYEHPSDRRIKMVELTTHGQQTRGSLIGDLAKRDGPILSKLTADEYETFIELLQKVTSSTPQDAFIKA